MKSYIIFLFTLLALCRRSPCAGETRDEYVRERKRFIDEERGEMIGRNVKLSGDEEKVNNLLMKLKLSEITTSLKDGTAFPPAIHFFRARAAIEASPVFKILRDMPKGGVLHIHDCSMADIHWLIQHVTYDPKCYMCVSEDAPLLFHYFLKPPANNKECRWQQVNSVRKKYSNMTEFDEKLYHSMTMIVDNPEVVYSNQDIVWHYFHNAMKTAVSLISYAPVFRDYCTQMLTELYEDNVQYVEVRAILFPVYELNGTLHDAEWSLEAYKTCVDEFKKSHPDFVGAKFIYTSIRSNNRSDLVRDLKTSQRLMKKFPSVFAGHDLASQEDKGHSLFYFLDELLLPLQSSEPLKYFFHAGETDWYGTSVDENVIDAILLNSSRLGHGYAITKHPKVMASIMKKGIALEVNPISNQVLMLLSDLRNHPMTSLIAGGYPVVISSDDPSLWGIKGVSYDFYEAFMGLGGAWADLKTLKELILNSFRYSAMSDTEKADAYKIWQRKWTEFIERTVKNYNL